MFTIDNLMPVWLLGILPSTFAISLIIIRTSSDTKNFDMLDFASMTGISFALAVVWPASVPIICIAYSHWGRYSDAGKRAKEEKAFAREVQKAKTQLSDEYM